MRRWVEHTQLRRSLRCYPFASRTSFFGGKSLLPTIRSERQDVSRLASRPLSTAQVSGQDGRRPVSQSPSVVLSRAEKPAEAVTKEANSKTSKPREDSHEYWVTLLEKYLPRDLSLSFKQESRTAFDGQRDAQDVLEILQAAQRHNGLDILNYMVLNQHRHKAVIYLANKLLEPTQNEADQSAAWEQPSNIFWPSARLSELSKAPIDLPPKAYVESSTPRATLARVFGGSDIVSGHETLMRLLWPVLANLVIASVRLSMEEGKQVMNTVHQIIARIHHVGLIPTTVYTYSMPQAPTTVQYPPILSLLTSRILSTLSDAVWRAYQDDEISRLLKEGRSHRDLISDVPGGRFRLKVRELGPEVWVEFILWCCVEGGFASAGARIIQALREDFDHPWYAIHWTLGGQGTENEIPKVDWDRVKRRHGGTVGPIEGYSREKPFVETPTRTISAEVVLALVDCLINTIDQGHVYSGLATADVLDKISNVVAFLEPHGLAPAYFDYLAVRVLQTENISLQTSPDALATWASTVSGLRSLQPVKARPFRKPGLSVDYVLEHSALEAGIFHQVLQRYIESSLTTKAVDTLTLLQKRVDASKLEAIGEFLSLAVRPQDGFFTSRPLQRHTEYIHSHGQLPEYKLPLIINMVTKARLFGLSDWLLYSADIDGPVIPVEVHGRPSIAIALSRHAAAKDDIFLMKSILAGSADSRRKPTVNLLRALVNAQIHFRAWDDVHYLLERLRKSEAGGYSPSIVANLAAMILRLQAESERQQSDTTEADLQQAEELLGRILNGGYDAPKADFNIVQKKAFRQQVGFLLRFLADIADSRLGDIAVSHINKFPVSNSPNLDLDTFHTIFAAVVEVKGALEARRMWEIFCKHPGPSTPSVINISDQSRLPQLEAEETSRNAPSSQSTPYPASARPSEQAGATPENVKGSSDVSLHHSVDFGEVQLPDESIRIPSVDYIDPFFRDEDLQNKEVLPSIVTQVEDPSSDIPFELEGRYNTVQDTSTESPIVVPDLHTLQILVRGALADKQSWRALSKENEVELNNLLAWAANTARAFDLSSEDIRRELNIPAAFHDALVLPLTSRARLRRSYKRSHKAMDVSSYFTRGVLSPKQAYIQRTGRSKKER